jgi:hypothetical protein
LELTDTEEAGGFVAIHFRHVTIHEDEVKRLFLKAGEGFATVGDGFGLVTEFPKELEGDLAVYEVVLSEEDAGVGSVGGGGSGDVRERQG